ncbi:hypothetical protein Ae201684_003678 [Aphanomyces euteiches]|uniref:Uncharacterized protein n=1 Tax=Aphanomyces euteiches TaxID=100861 RepID=A0A6G0XL62_9STRA|nr:hypothetical protein Ae201684_003678 [Aphanomyces euteiches]
MGHDCPSFASRPSNSCKQLNSQYDQSDLHPPSHLRQRLEALPCLRHDPWCDQQIWLEHVPLVLSSTVKAAPNRMMVGSLAIRVCPRMSSDAAVLRTKGHPNKSYDYLH